ncbi:MAG: hypothetical protein ACE5E5_16465 [Phycisphaerae bacterium]
MQIAASVILLIFGIAVAARYLIKPVLRKGNAAHDTAPGGLAGDRPGRRLGAGICLVLAVMFAVGVNIVDVPAHPRAYAIYWIIMLALVVWLGVLAVKDARHTRNVVADRRVRRKQASRRIALDLPEETKP